MILNLLQSGRRSHEYNEDNLFTVVNELFLSTHPTFFWTHNISINQSVTF